MYETVFVCMREGESERYRGTVCVCVYVVLVIDVLNSKTLSLQHQIL